MKIKIIILSLFGFLLLGACTKGTSQVVLQSISFTPDTITIRSGNSLQLAPVFTPSVFSSIDVEWNTTDVNIVHVIRGQLLTTAGKTGSAWITIKDKNSATSGKCLVIVN